jgi:hypothetical protein
MIPGYRQGVVAFTRRRLCCIVYIKEVLFRGDFREKSGGGKELG